MYASNHAPKPRCPSYSASAALNERIKQITGSGNVIRGFRHSFRDRLRAVSAPIHMIDQLGTWSLQRVGQGYGVGYTLESSIQARHQPTIQCLTSQANTRLREAGHLSNILGGLIGLASKFPPQFGHTFEKVSFAHLEQKVHSKEHITAFGASGGRSASQHSQFGRNSSIVYHHHSLSSFLDLLVVYAVCRDCDRGGGLHRFLPKAP